MAFGLFLPTNCGNLTPRTFEPCSISGTPDITHSHIPYFHRMMCNWAYNIPLQFQWVLVISAQNISYLKNRIKQRIQEVEPDGWNISSTVDTTWTNATQDVIGCIFAQGVDIPGESINVQRVGVSEGSNRGFINAPIITGRSSFSDLQVGFLETNKSFVDGVLRPWSILVAHEGLVAQRNSIKADITIYELSKAGECTPNIIRKQWNFRDCAPVMISSEQKTYSSNDYPKRQVSFVFNSYQVTDLSENYLPINPSQLSTPLININPLNSVISDNTRNTA